MGTTERSRPWEAEPATTAFQMIDVGNKEPTRRRAVARGTIRMETDAFAALREGRNPKGDVLKLAEVAGIQAAKHVADLLPLCHPLPLESVRFRFETDANACTVTAICECRVTGKTGVEMEALAGVNGALLAIYDLSKAVNPVLSISGIRLDEKEGGKQGMWTHPDADSRKSAGPDLPFSGIQAAALTVSDRCSSGSAEDRSGPILRQELEVRGATLVGQGIVPDDPDAIRGAVRSFVLEKGARLVITSGGTGLGPRDVTPEAMEPLWTRRLPGFGERLRAHGSLQTGMAWLSRSEAGLVGEALVILLPGNPRAASDGIGALEALIPHALSIIQGGSH